MELKNPLTGQSYHDAVRQYRTTRGDPQEPLLAFGRCLAHFAVDPDEVWFTTHLCGDKTVFFPFNQGRNGGAGNPIPARSSGRFATAYLLGTDLGRRQHPGLARTLHPHRAGHGR